MVIASGTGSPTLWSNAGQEKFMPPFAFRTASTNDTASNVHSAPLRLWALAGLGISSSWDLDRWNPSIGITSQRRLPVHSLIHLRRFLARVVFPEPGHPAIPIRRRLFVLQLCSWHAWSVKIPRISVPVEQCRSFSCAAFTIGPFLEVDHSSLEPMLEEKALDREQRDLHIALMSLRVCLWILWDLLSNFFEACKFIPNLSIGLGCIRCPRETTSRRAVQSTWCTALEISNPWIAFLAMDDAFFLPCWHHGLGRFTPSYSQPMLFDNQERCLRSGGKYSIWEGSVSLPSLYRSSAFVSFRMVRAVRLQMYRFVVVYSLCLRSYLFLVEEFGFAKKYLFRKDIT